MGYHTCLKGMINISPYVKGPRLQYLRAFTNCRHMRLNLRECERIADPLRRAVGLPSGFWTIPDNWAPPLVLSTGCPGMAPSFNCPWEICEDGSAVVWNKVEKPKAYDAWLEVLATLMKYWGHELQGSIEYEGEQLADQGILQVNTTLDPLQWTQTTGKAFMSGNLICETTASVGHWKSLVLQSLHSDNMFWPHAKPLVK